MAKVSIAKTKIRRYSSVYIKSNNHAYDYIRPFIYQINYHKDGRLKSVYQYIDRYRWNRKYTYLSIWQVVLTILYLLCILIILLAALVLIHTAPRKSLLNEPCGVRTCEKTLKLQCIANRCQCKSTQYYSKGCVDKRQYLKTCHNQTSYCQDNKGLICIDGFCQCNETLYWNGLKCVPKGSISSTCRNDTQCLTQLILVCDTSLKMCSCNTTTRFWDGGVCYLKQSIGEPCNSNDMCLASRGLTCLFGICSCDPLTEFSNGIRCQTKKPVGSPCVFSVECNNTGDVYCILSTCQPCPRGFFYNGTDCQAQKEYNETCNSALQCYTPGLLSCINGKCECPLPIAQQMYWVPEFKECRILPKNCREIQSNDTTAKSGIFYLATPVGLLEAYCEMVIDGGGYTFFPWSSLSASTNMLQEIYEDTSKVLFRIISRANDTDQPYILTRQLPQYSNIPIAIQENSWTGYTRPSNLQIGSFVYIAFFPASIGSVIGMTQGFSANGRNISFSNCDGNPNSYFTLYANQNPTGTSSYGVPGSGLVDKWISSSLPHPDGTYMPSKYFFFVEVHMGGCGVYQQSDRWTYYYGAAFGMK